MIFQFEKKVLEWIQNNIVKIVLVVVSILGCIIRFSLRDFVSVDASAWLLPWYDQIKANGGLRGLGIPIDECNYNFPYMLLVAFLTYIPIKPLYSYKLLSCIFDYLLAIIVGKIVYRLTDNKTKGIIAFAITLSSPLVILNSAAWAQCDSIYTFFVVLALYYLIEEKELYSFIALGFAFAFKLQAVLILPFFVLYYLYKKRITVLYFCILPLPLIGLSVPALAQGRTIREMIKIYVGNTDLYGKISMNYPSIWNLVTASSLEIGYETLKNAAILLAVVALGMIMLCVIAGKIEFSGTNQILLAFIMCYTAVIMLPAMHERYGFVYEILAIIVIFLLPKTIVGLCCLIGISMITYGNFLFDQQYNLLLLSAVNIAVYLIYTRELFCVICKNRNMQ